MFILIAGLRYRLGIDTPNYLNLFYHFFPTYENFHWKDYPLGDDPLYAVINSVVISLGGRFYVVQLIQASIVNVLIFKYIKRHTPYIFTSVFFYFTLYCYLEFNMEIMRGGISIVICLFANDYILERKWIKGYLLYCIACLFHGQTIVMLTIPLFLFLKMNIKGFAILVLSFVIGHFLQAALSEYVSMLEMADVDSSLSDKASGYVNSDKYGTQGGNLNFYLVNIFPWLVYAFVSVLYLKRNCPNSNILRLEPFVMIGMLFLILQMNIQVVYRYVDYFRLYFLLFFVETFVDIVKRGKCYTLPLSYTRAIVFFFPLFFLIGYLYFLRGYQYYPYSSVIERSIDQNRESKILEERRPRANVNEY